MESVRGDRGKALFENAFPKKSLWNEIRFNNQAIDIGSRYVAWIDVMGSRKAMVNTLRNAMCFVGNLHTAVLKAELGFKDSVEIHSMTDGVYAISESFDKITQFVTCIMRSCARCFLEDTNPQNRFMIRSGISFGKVALSQDMAKGFQCATSDDKYIRNVMLGIPFVRAEQAEHKAPPFGVYIDEEVRTQTDAALKVSWVLHRWWNQEDYNEKTFAAYFGELVLKHLDVLKENPIGMYSPDVKKLEEYHSSVKEYFKVIEKDGNKRES